MNSEQKPSPAQRGTFLRFGPRLFTWPRVRRGLLVLVWLVTLVALFYAEEDWRGRHAWGKYAQQLQARGEPIGNLIPKSVPDDQNFAMTPSLAPLFDFVPGTQQFRDKSALAMVQDPPPGYKNASGKVKDHQEGNWARGMKVDFVAWALAYEPALSKSTLSAFPDRAAAAKSVLADLQEWTPLLTEIQSASQRPYSRFNIRYDEENTPSILLPHLSVLKRFVQVLKLRAAAELAAGQTGPALQDVDLAFKITNAIKDEPILISCLVRMSEIQLCLQPIWEGMAVQAWSPDQLKELQQKLSGLDVLAEARKAFGDDRAALGNTTIEFVRKSPLRRVDAIGLFDDVNPGTGYGSFASMFLCLVPSGWFYQEELEYDRIFDRLVMPLIDINKRQVSPELASRTQQDLQQLLQGDPLTLTLRHRLFARLLVPAVSSLAPKVARTQTAVDLGVTACALERYRLANGHYPDDLTQLVPAFLATVPHDVIDGKPLRYHQEGGRFVLYSIGWNAQDDSGKFPSKPEGGPEFKRGLETAPPEAGDWVWRYPAS